LIKKPGAVYRQHSNSVTKNAAIENRMMKDFQFWLDVSSKKATPYYINEKERRKLALSLAQTYLKLHCIPSYNILFYYRYILHFFNAGKFVAKESPFILPSLVWFILGATTKLIGRRMKCEIKSVSNKEENEITHIKYLLPKSS